MQPTKEEFQRQRESAVRKIDERKNQVAELTKQRRALNIDQVGAASKFSDAISRLENETGFLTDLLNQIDTQLEQWAGNMSAAAEKRTLVIAADERCREHNDALIKLQQETRLHIEALLKENGTIGRLDEEHLGLVGQRMNIPHIAVPFQASNFAASNVPPIQPLRPWQYASEEERAAIRKQDLEKRLEQYEKRIEIAEEHAPLCPQCLLGNIETKMLVNRREGKEDSPGESIYHGQWRLKCPKCGATQTVAIPETK
jgi:hypothetical protein